MHERFEGEREDGRTARTANTYPGTLLGSGVPSPFPFPFFSRPLPPPPFYLPPGRRPPTLIFAALRHRNFRLFFVGQFVSLCGTWMQTVAQGWLVLQLTNSAFAVGLVTALGSLPILLLTLYGGVVADRVNKRRLVVVLQMLMLTRGADPGDPDRPPPGDGALGHGAGRVSSGCSQRSRCRPGRR